MVLLDLVQPGRQGSEAPSCRWSWRGILRRWTRDECNDDGSTRLARGFICFGDNDCITSSFTWSLALIGNPDGALRETDLTLTPRRYKESHDVNELLAKRGGSFFFKKKKRGQVSSSKSRTRGKCKANAFSKRHGNSKRLISR